MAELPIYYKPVRFTDAKGKVHEGYLEPPFSEDDCAFFFEENSADLKQGLGGIFYHPDDIMSWEYLPEPPEVNYVDVDF